MALSREQKIAKAREMRAEGKMAAEIALVVGAPESTVRNWYLGGNCEGCGAPIDGSSQRGRPRHCADCAPRAHATWDKARIVQAIREWADLYGEAPTSTEWNPALAARVHPPAVARLMRKRFESGDWPTPPTVANYFGSWNAALVAAGFEARSAGAHRGPGSASARLGVAA